MCNLAACSPADGQNTTVTSTTALNAAARFLRATPQPVNDLDQRTIKLDEKRQMQKPHETNKKKNCEKKSPARSVSKHNHNAFSGMGNGN